MKKLAAIACLTLLASGAFAQGFVNFLNGTATYVSTAPGVAASGSAGSYFYGLMTAAPGTTDPAAFSFSGLYGTNLATAGTVFGGNNRTVANWAAGVSKAFYIAGWSASLGHDYVAADFALWLKGETVAGTSGVFGISAIKAGAAGGVDATGATVPNLNLFGGANGLTAGWIMSPVPIPEPTTMALAGLGAAALLIFRRRK